MIFRGILNFIPGEYIQKTKFKKNFILLFALEQNLRTPLITKMVEAMIRIDFDDENKKMILVAFPDSYIEKVFGELDKLMEKRCEEVIKCKCSLLRLLIQVDPSYLQRYLDLFELA